MAEKPRHVDLNEALVDPAAVFGAPEDVLSHDHLAREQKVEILRRWEYDAHELEVAEEEGMGSEPPSDLLDRILRALHALGARPDIEHSPPTKQGGI